MKIVISNDHAATGLKDIILEHLQQKKSLSVTDLGSKGEQGADYPEYAYNAAKGITSGEYDFGIFICGTGVGMCIAANKIRGIRAAVCSEPYTARLAREHNDAQILCIGARVVGGELAKMIVDEFLDAKFEGGRHKTRVDMFMAYEKE